MLHVITLLSKTPVDALYFDPKSLPLRVSHQSVTILHIFLITLVVCGLVREFRIYVILYLTRNLVGIPQNRFKYPVKKWKIIF